jgi:hypothetical protein
MREGIYEEENMFDDGELHFMYDSAYDEFETIHDLTPYYKLLNQLFRYTLYPKSGDSDKIFNYPRTCLLGWLPTSTSLASFTSFGRKSSSDLFYRRKAVTMHHTSLP